MHCFITAAFFCSVSIMWLLAQQYTVLTEAHESRNAYTVNKKLLRFLLCFQLSKGIKISEDQVKSDSTPAIFDYLLQHKKHSETVICIEDCKFGVRVQLLKFCSGTTRMKEIHKLLSSSIYYSPGRRYMFLGPFVPFRWICRLEIKIPG